MQSINTEQVSQSKVMWHLSEPAVWGCLSGEESCTISSGLHLKGWGFWCDKSRAGSTFKAQSFLVVEQEERAAPRSGHHLTEIMSVLHVPCSSPAFPPSPEPSLMIQAILNFTLNPGVGWLQGLWLWAQLCPTLKQSTAQSTEEGRNENDGPL